MDWTDFCFLLFGLCNPSELAPCNSSDAPPRLKGDIYEFPWRASRRRYIVLGKHFSCFPWSVATSFILNLFLPNKGIACTAIDGHPVMPKNNFGKPATHLWASHIFCNPDFADSTWGRLCEDAVRTLFLDAPLDIPLDGVRSARRSAAELTWYLKRNWRETNRLVLSLNTPHHVSM